jgi:DNA-binding CsgD family transcriptional regulator
MMQATLTELQKGALRWLHANISTENNLIRLKTNYCQPSFSYTGQDLDELIEQAGKDYAKWDETLDPLSLKELQVCDYIVNGLTTKEAATQLGTSPQMVRHYLSSIYSKLGVSKRIDMVKMLVSG